MMLGETELKTFFETLKSMTTTKKGADQSSEWVSFLSTWRRSSRSWKVRRVGDSGAVVGVG